MRGSPEWPGVAGAGETGREHRELDLILDTGNLITAIFSFYTMMHLYHNLKITLNSSDCFFKKKTKQSLIFWLIQIIPVCSAVYFYVH